MTEVDVTERSRRAGQRRAAAAADADVLRAVLRRQSLAEEAVIERRHGLAQLPQARHRRVLLIVDAHRDLVHPRWRARQIAGLRLALADVGPRRIADAILYVS